MVKKGTLRIKSINVEGSGAIILTGPSGGGKGEIARYLVKILQLDSKYHLSMGEILRSILKQAKQSPEFLDILSNKYKISNSISVFDEENNDDYLIKKVKKYVTDVEEMISNDSFFSTLNGNITQFAWLNYAVENGLLIPDDWTKKILEATFENNDELRKSIFVLDGYPRTIEAAKHMLKLFDKLSIKVIKVIHLSITKSEMKRRAQLRNRLDDNLEALENRFDFYVDHVQPSIDEIKEILGSDFVSLIDAHQPFYDYNGNLNVPKSIDNVARDVINSIGLDFS